MLTWLPTVLALMRLLPVPMVPVVVRSLRRLSKMLRTLLVVKALRQVLPRLVLRFLQSLNLFFRE